MTVVPISQGERIPDVPSVSANNQPPSVHRVLCDECSFIHITPTINRQGAAPHLKPPVHFAVAHRAMYITWYGRPFSSSPPEQDFSTGSLIGGLIYKPPSCHTGPGNPIDREWSYLILLVSILSDFQWKHFWWYWKRVYLHCLYKSLFLQSAVIEIVWERLLKEETVWGSLYVKYEK